MTVADEPAELAPRPERPRRLLGPAFWALIAFGLVCIVLGAVIGVYGARLFPAARPAAPVAAPAAAPTVPPPAAPPTAILPAPPPPTGAVAELGKRLDKVETDHRSTVQAAAAAIAVSAAAEAAETSRPFVRELDAVARLMPDSPDFMALRELAVSGAPTRTGLIAAFPAAADRAAAAARAPANGEGVLARLTHALAALVVMRRIDQVAGQGPDAVLARAERRADEGDLAGALKELDALPPAGRTALADWRSGAERRVAIERRISAIRGVALRGLVQATRSEPVG
ncbi:MAG: mitofilin family membrane protein [Caulobacteraceae bacterium]